ncbi:RNA-directed DNA polymerase from mobile element jockey [Trichonephila clavipes]|nr:RNA-directed DNA polymerase from mobile element jockey [Trichonephila clavipes]
MSVREEYIRNGGKEVKLPPDTPTHFNTYHTNAILDIGFAVNLSHTEVFTINELSSDHNPVIFDFVTNNVLPPILRTLKSTNWTKFQEIIYHNIPGNPQIDDLDLAVQNFTSNISNAISSTSTRLINTPHLRLPENIRELIRAKNRFRKLWNTWSGWNGLFGFRKRGGFQRYT